MTNEVDGLTAGEVAELQRELFLELLQLRKDLWQYALDRDDRELVQALMSERDDDVWNVLTSRCRAGSDLHDDACALMEKWSGFRNTLGSNLMEYLSLTRLLERLSTPELVDA